MARSSPFLGSRKVQVSSGEINFVNMQTMNWYKQSIRRGAMGGMGLFCIALGMLWTGCGSEAAEVPITEKHAAGTRQMTVARLEVDGMMCEVACGSKIRKELLELAGVANADIDFEADRERNFAEVEFDPSQLGVEDLIRQIQAIADGIYEVKQVEVTHFAQSGEL